MNEWIYNNFELSMDGTEIIIHYEKVYVFQIPIEKVFIPLFGEVIQSALDNGIDLIQAIRDCDPNNVQGYNDLL